MTNERNDEPAFPIAGAVAAYQYPGLSLRDYFAAKAMGAFCAGASGMGGFKTEEVREQFEIVARFAYIAADAMLKARAE